MQDFYQVHEYGHVKLEDKMGSDLSIVNAARVSFNAEHKNFDDDSDSGLINYLMKHKHGTPFEMVQFAFDVKVPIFVMREQIRHRISSFNEMSARYTEMLPEYYIPKGDYIRTQVGKPGHYTFEAITDEAVLNDINTAFRNQKSNSWAEYQWMMKHGVAKEVARMVLPVNIYTRFKWSVNLRSMFNYLALRNDDRALREIRDYAVIFEEYVHQVAPVALAAFQDNGRVAP